MTYLVAAFVVAVGLADWLSTARVLRGGGRELNPVVARVQALLGDRWGLAKAGLHVACAAAVVLVGHPITTSLAFVAAAFNAGVVLHNCREART